MNIKRFAVPVIPAAVAAIALGDNLADRLRTWGDLEFTRTWAEWLDCRSLDSVSAPYVSFCRKSWWPTSMIPTR